MSWLAFGGAAVGLACTPSDHHYPEPRPQPRPPCAGERAPRQWLAAGYPGLMLGDEWSGGSSSWTHDGDPPAGDRCTPPPPDVKAPG